MSQLSSGLKYLRSSRPTLLLKDKEAGRVHSALFISVEEII